MLLYQSQCVTVLICVCYHINLSIRVLISECLCIRFSVSLCPSMCVTVSIYVTVPISACYCINLRELLYRPHRVTVLVSACYTCVPMWSHWIVPCSPIRGSKDSWSELRALLNLICHMFKKRTRLKRHHGCLLLSVVWFSCDFQWRITDRMLSYWCSFSFPLCSLSIWRHPLEESEASSRK